MHTQYTQWLASQTPDTQARIQTIMSNQQNTLTDNTYCGILLPSGAYMACTEDMQPTLMRQLPTKDAFLAIYLTPHALTHHIHNNTNRDVHPMKDAMYQALNIHDAYTPHIIITHAQRSWLDTHHTAFTQEQRMVYEECFTKRQHDYHTITPRM